MVISWMIGQHVGVAIGAYFEGQMTVFISDQNHSILIASIPPMSTHCLCTETSSSKFDNCNQKYVLIGPDAKTASCFSEAGYEAIQGNLKLLK